MRNEIFIVRKGRDIVGFCDTMADAALFVGASLSAVSRSVNFRRPTRLGYMVEKRERVYLCKTGERSYALNTAVNMTEGCLDISTCYYKRYGCEK